LNAQHVELAGEIAEGDCAVAGHRPRLQSGSTISSAAIVCESDVRFTPESNRISDMYVPIEGRALLFAPSF
jgi:hypothetical protein